MDEIVQALNNIANAISQNSMPLIISIIAIAVPIALTIVSIVQAIVQNKQSRNLQKLIHNNEINLQSRENILQIYNSFVNALGIVCQGQNKVEYIFSNPNSTDKWLNDLISANNSLTLVMNQAELFFRRSNPDLIIILKKCKESFRNLFQSISSYANDGQLLMVQNQAWNTISLTFGIPFGNYWLLQQNNMAMQQFLQLNTTDETKKIQKEIDEFISLFQYDKFDIYFEEYLSIQKV